MPRWFFLLIVTCLVLSVVGGVLIVLRSPGDAPAPRPAADPAKGGTMSAPPAPVPQTGGGGR